ncbi:Small subunit ribosomal protein S36 [Gigaspora margarita]|uniref:Small subunit ribosomal protein S36 n=1 Tax=Gigaspora margarita TaxID=4874 RepID=A0A8H3X9M1_GIGMA|nr:Small subunit ribosomal protein S36 [Gigaspora margarita]
MIPSKIRFALQKHVPLIKFLGPRSKLHKEPVDNTPKPHPAAPKGSSLPSASQESIANNRSVNQKLVIEYSELPEKYKRKILTFEEIETIESGGAYLINY